MIQNQEPQMTASERSIMEFFRRYQAGPDEMLFFNPTDCKMPPAPFRNAMQSLIRRSLVTKERPKQAYSLTRNGYDMSLSMQPVQPVLRARGAGRRVNSL